MRFLTALVGVFLSAALACAGDWPCWRGPDHNGISKETGWVQQWPEAGPPVAWKGKVGLGFAAFSVHNGLCYTTGHADGKDTVFCLDALTGKEKWKHAYDAELGDLYFQGGTTSTPTVHAGKLYHLSRWGDLFCFDAANGNVVWSRQIAKDDKLPVPTWGFACAPRIHEKLLLLNAGKSGMALDKDTGKPIWTSEAAEAGYTTPILYQQGGATVAIVSSGKAFAAVNVQTGKPLWELRWLTRYGVNAADPIVAGNQVFLSSGYNKGDGLFDLAANPPRPMWQNKDLCTQLSPAVLLDGHLYGIDGDTTGEASLRCLDWKTGKVQWTEKDVGNGGLLAADGKLIVLTGKGELLVAPASSKEFKPTARAMVLGGTCWTAPVLANGLIYCRNGDGEVVAVDLRGKK